MDLNEIKLLICSKIETDSTTSIVNIYFKYGMCGHLLAYSIEDDEALEPI